MLEFSNEFFDQEVREGFYIDATMKTVWAAELEVLQRVAEVCDKYNMKWYAAYGTLLGAIRHEGFVPWDDDMDIWVMRKDYNKLMEILPKELPEGYIVQSPMNEFGYDQFHSCVINGEGIDITPKKLAEYHNCPFTVCLDVFPLDYLPRNEGERSIQKNLVELAGRAAMLAKELKRDEFEENEEGKEKKNKLLSEILTAVEYLESFCSFRLDRDYIEKENWRKVSSELWRCANYVAMMYDEEDADYIVEYLDFDRWEHKKFPKHWFDETYSASFEGFMLPIPGKYHEVLFKIYGHYNYFVQKTGSHEYPFYARQLRQLREYVKNMENKAEKCGLIKPEELVVNENLEMPKEWLCHVKREDGEKKRIVLMANDPMLYVEDTEMWLDKLEETVKFFKAEQDSMTLWWRPHPMMPKILNQIAPEMSQRYLAMLDQYKQEDWGICDESDNVECAARNCDMYYGEKNAIVQTVQNEQKAVIIRDWNIEEAIESNKKREKERRVAMHYTDNVICNDKKYFACSNYNAFVIMDLKTKEIEKMIPFDGERIETANLHLHCFAYRDKVVFVPVGKHAVHIYDMHTEKMSVYTLEIAEVIPESTWGYYFDEKQFYLLPCSAKAGLWKWNDDLEIFEKQDWWCIGSEEDNLAHGTISENRFFTLKKSSSELYITDVAAKTILQKKLPYDDVIDVWYDGEDFWGAQAGKSGLFKWNLLTDEYSRLEIHLGDAYDPKCSAEFYEGIYVNDSIVILAPQVADRLYVFDKQSMELMYEVPLEIEQDRYTFPESRLFFREEAGLIEIRFRNHEIVMILDVAEKSCSFLVEEYQVTKKIRDYQKRVLFAKKPLIYEVDGEYDLNTIKLIEN